MGYINLTARRRVPYMDSYVFGAAFYYGVMVLFTLYMFLRGVIQYFMTRRLKSILAKAAA